MGFNAQMHETERRIARLLRRRDSHVRYLISFAFAAILVASAVALIFSMDGIAATHTEQVLDCQFSGDAAHTHDEKCYDEEGNLACPLVERELHVHTDACYTETRELACGLEESEGHAHADACYDDDGNLTCGQEESAGHAHDDSCYAVTRELTCGKEEVTEEHTHGPGCFRTVTVDDGDESDEDASSSISSSDDQRETSATRDANDAPTEDVSAAAYPAQSFTHNIKDQDDKLVLRVSVDAPEGALPAESTMQVSWIDADGLSEKQQKAVEKAVAKKTDGKLTELQAVDITFLDAEGVKVEPAAKVTVTLTSSLVDTDDEPVVVHVDDLTKAQEKAMAKGGDEPKRKAQVVDALSEKELAKRDMELADDQLAFESDEFSTYVLAVTTLQKVLVASDDKTYTVTVDAPAAAGIPQDAELAVEEILGASEQYEAYVSKTEHALGMEQGSAEYIRLFDISIVDKDGAKIQPWEGTTVDVRIELADNSSEEFSVVHFAEGAVAGDVVDAEVDSQAVSFEATGFSVYAVVDVDVDAGGLDGKTYGLINTKDGTKPSGIALTSTAQNNGTKLQGKSTTVRVNTVNRTDYVYVASNSNITMWTFHSASNGKYYISTQVNGTTKYLKVSTSGVSLVDNPDDEDCVFTVTEGTGTYAGKYRFSTANGALRLNGSNFERTGVNTNNAGVWMNFAELSNLNEDDFVTYTAQKVSIAESAEEVNNGDMVIVYTRIWNSAENHYDYYVVDYDGKLVKAYESGDTISWVGSQINTMLWDFTEYYEPGTTTPNGYYELQNNFSGKYIAPKTSNGSETFLSDSTIGINLNGRGNGDYYTTILAWDDYYYASLKVDEANIKLLSSTLAQASDFYFAKMSTDTATMDVTTVSTVDSTQYGITLKMQDFGDHDALTDGRSEEMDDILGATKYEQWTGTKDLLQNYIAGGSDYPVATYSNKSLSELFSKPMEVNNQFLKSTYFESGYFEYDSTKNFSHLITSVNDPWYGLDAPNGKKYEVGDFVVYGQLGTSSEGNKDTLRHGQFLPYNDIISGFQTDSEGKLVLDEDGNPIPIAIKVSTKYQNTMDIHADPLSSLDPAYGEALYEITWKNTHILPYVDHFFGMEMSASFMQSADGLDAWGHDLIFEFSGDDDFWLYVDDVMVLDLGGIHSALDGSVNFRTGRVVENGTEYWLKDRFEAAYRAQHAGEADLEENLQNWLKGIFKVETTVVDGVEREVITSVFKDYSSHTMRMFYLERGAGASNIHMRFNISEYKEGRVQLQKVVSGTENSDELFPFQIWYEDPHTHVMVRATNSMAVTDAQTDEQIPYEDMYRVQAGDNTLVYKDVFFLKAGQMANIQLPSEDTPYYIKECAMDSPATYDWVKINDALTNGSTVAPQEYNGNPVDDSTTIQAGGRLDFDTKEAKVSDRKKVVYENHVNAEALKTLSITKRLWQDEQMKNEIFSGIGEDADNTGFSFRVYIGMEDGTYTFYKNGPYRVKNPQGEYCYFHQGDFVSTGKKVFSEITDDLVNNDPAILLGDTLQQRCTFHTGRGSVTRIKAGYTVEIPGLLNGTPFVVLERDGEIPSGYNRLGYEANDSGTVVTGELLTTTTEGKESSLLMAGTINGDQSVTVHNQHGYSLMAKKVWSDAAFMTDHDEIYFAVYLKDGDALTLIPDSVRQLGKKGTSLSWFFPELAEGKSLNDYEVYEVMLKVPEGSTLGAVTVDGNGKVSGYMTVDGDVETSQGITEANIIRIEEGETLIAGGTSNEHGYSASMEYVAGYSREVLVPGADGEYPNTRTDTVTNSRPGIKIVKTDDNDAEPHPLEGGVFTLSRSNDGSSNDDSSTKTFTSDENGLVVVAYLLPDTEYLLTESTAPYGYQALIDKVTIKVDVNGVVYVNGSNAGPENGYYTITQVATPTATNMPTVTIKNKDVRLKAVKIDSYTERPLAGVTFALYKEEYASTNGLPDPNRPMPDYTPMEGYEELVTDADGVIPRIKLKNADNPDGLPAGSYYLREKDAPAGYMSLGVDIRITISLTGEVTIQSAKRPEREGQDWAIGTISSDIAEIRTVDGALQITVKNTPNDPIRIKKVDMVTGSILAGVSFDLYRSSQVEDGKPRQNETPVLSGTTDEKGILNLGGLEGLYFLFETETLPGYNLLTGPITIQVDADNNTVTAQSGINGPLVCKKVKDDGGKDVWQITVENSAGVELPASGGPGTNLLYLLGSALVLFAGTVLVIARRRGWAN